MNEGALTLGRRGMVAGALLMPSLAWAGIPATRRLAFDVLRKGSRIGGHVITFEPAGPDFAVRVAVDILVKFGGIVLYRYTLRATETWQAGTLVAAAAETNDDGTKQTMRATRRDGRLVVEGTHGPTYTAPEKSICASHWNPAELQAPMIDLQDGELLDFKVASRGPATIPGHTGAIETEHYTLTGPATLDLWYDRRNVWSQLRAVARDGSIIDYRHV